MCSHPEQAKHGFPLHWRLVEFWEQHADSLWSPTDLLEKATALQFHKHINAFFDQKNKFSEQVTDWHFFLSYSLIEGRGRCE